MEQFPVTAIGWVSSSRREPVDDDWGEIESTIQLDAAFEAESLRGLADFSHVEVVYLFHLVDLSSIVTDARRPRDNPSWPEVGIFAQRAKNRPNRLGLSTCDLVAVEGSTIRVRGLDAIDGTPVLDIKPFMMEFGPRGSVRQPAWSRELMAEYY